LTYCLAITVGKGLVFASDSRTNAGVDQLSTYRKMFTFGTEGKRVFVLLAAGNLATTQAVIANIERDIKKGVSPGLPLVADMEEAAEYVGQISAAQQKKHETPDSGARFDASASFILGGQVQGEEPRVYMIYPEGNHIQATEQTPYQQVGEIKYGKPILDRIIRRDTSLEEAALCALVSMDSTMRSNATVGPPLDILIYARDSFSLQRHFIFREDDPYLLELKTVWDAKLKAAFSELHRYNWSEPPRISDDQSL
jgi:putative proteasome-type protease